jgi:SAM-dependent methyltransferase
MKYPFLLILLITAASLNSCIGQDHDQSASDYVYKNGSPNGIGKWYMGREIAHVMGYQGIGWLERPEREKEENTSKLLSNMNIGKNDHVADIGAGSGYHVFNMAVMIESGHIYAVDIQQQMLDAMQEKIIPDDPVTLIKGSEKSINIKKSLLDKILMVDVYHEFNFPKEMLASMYDALKPDGAIYLIEYRGEDPTIPIKTIHKMTENQAVKEMKAAGFRLEENIGNLPWQHCMVFTKIE